MSSRTEKNYAIAKEIYAEAGVDTEEALQKLEKIAISLHCWQGDDVGGFEVGNEALSGGIAVTGNYPGRASRPEELRADIDEALKLIPGTHRLNLHACYLESEGKNVDRNELEPAHFQNWIDWAKERKMGLDFNGTFFSHPKADGFTLASADEGIRKFWVEHGIASRKVAEEMGKQLGTPAVTNVWIPDGFKDIPVDRKAPRERLIQSLDEIFAENISTDHNIDAVECKLFGIGTESCTIGSHEIYMGYAVKNQKYLCLDAGHFHPTEVISDKISSILNFVPGIITHVSRGVRWDSDHVIIKNDELVAIAQEIIRGGFLDRTCIGLDFFDASINRIAAWTIGTRNMIKALLEALLEPIDQLRQAENSGDYTSRLALLEEAKTLPLGAVWDYYCEKMDVPVGQSWLKDVKMYEKNVLESRP